MNRFKNTTQLSLRSESEADSAFTQLIIENHREMLLISAKRILSRYFLPGSSDYNLCLSLVEEWENAPVKNDIAEAMILWKARRKAEDFDKVKQFFEELWRSEEHQKERFRQRKHNIYFSDQGTRENYTQLPDRLLCPGSIQIPTPNTVSLSPEEREIIAGWRRNVKVEKSSVRLSQSDNPHTKEAKQHMQERVLSILERDRKKTVRELAEETGLSSRTVYRYLGEWEPLHFFTLNNGVVEVLTSKVPLFAPEAEPGYHHIYGKIANQERGDPLPPDLKKYCKKIKETHPYFIDHPKRSIVPWPANAEDPKEFFIGCGEDQLPASQLSVLIGDLSKDLGELGLYGYDLALDVEGKHRRLSVYWKDSSHKGIETEIKIYSKSEDIQRIEGANMRIPIKTPEDALVVAQILDLRIDFMSQHIFDKNTIKMLSEALEKALKKIAELEAQIDVLFLGCPERFRLESRQSTGKYRGNATLATG